MKATRQRLINEKRSDTLEQMKKKNENSRKLIDKNKNDRWNRIHKMNSTLQTDETIRRKMQTHFEKLEEDRLEIERLIDTRSN